MDVKLMPLNSLLSLEKMIYDRWVHSFTELGFQINILKALEEKVNT